MTSNRLLVIDDEPLSSATIGRIARSSGYDTIITTDTDDFRSRVTEWEPTVIVLDLAMPEMNGRDLLCWLSKQACAAQVLIVSGREAAVLQEAETFGKSLGLSMAGFLQKPLHAEVLRTAFRNIYDVAGVISIQDVSKALVNQEIRVMYQPQVDLKTGTTIGFEALARWDHPKRGPISPATFIPLLEGKEIMREFTFQILEMVMDDMVCMNSRSNCGVAINISATNCGSVELAEVVVSMCSSREIPADRITLEVTETAAMTEGKPINACLERLDELGVRLSIDDFGTGYSSLIKLHKLPFSELKIDQSFIANCVFDRQSSVLVQAMIDLAHNMGKRVVAEGVETEETLNQIREWGCDIGQGYFISRPLLPEDMHVWIDREIQSGREWSC